MRLITKTDAKTILPTIKAGENFEEPKTFYIEKAKGNVLPKHFVAEENKDKTKMTINGHKTVASRNIDRSAYVGFCLPIEGEKDENGEQVNQCYYVRDHSFVENTEYVTYKKPEREAAPKKEKAVKPEDMVPTKKGQYEVTNVKTAESRTLSGSEFIKEFGLEKATAILNGRNKKTWTADEYAGEASPKITTEQTMTVGEGETGAA